MANNEVIKDTLLIELGMEELPPKQIKKLEHAFLNLMHDSFREAQIGFSVINAYSTPRRLALLFNSLESRQAEQTIERKGPAISASYDKEGRPTQAALGFAKSCGVEVSALETLDNHQGAWLYFKKQEAGKTLEQLLPQMIRVAIRKLPIARRMRWGHLKEDFVRPVQWLTVLYGDTVIPMKLFDIDSDSFTHGHRFLSSEKMVLKNANDYQKTLLKQGFVIPDFNARKAQIKLKLEEVGTKAGGHAFIDDALLEEVCGLIEWPNVLVGEFDESFLSLPPEVLITSMNTHQKCFPLFDKNNDMLAKFLIVSNMETKDPGAIIRGNQRVMNARLADAKFFYEVDLKQSLSERLDTLKQIVYQQKLGSLYDKSQRIAQLGKVIASLVGEDEEIAETVGSLCKADLVTDMVGEFPALQGTMGRYYAEHDQLSPPIPQALEESYLPRFSGDKLPETGIGAVIAIAEKIDTIVGIFSLQGTPKGDRDPYGLRRATLGIIRILIDKQWNIDFENLLKQAKSCYEQELALEDQTKEDYFGAILDFFFDRMRYYFLDLGTNYKVIDAVITKRISDPFEFYRRVNAVKTFLDLPEAEALAAANKRVRNILTKSDLKDIDKKPVNPGLLKEPAEIALAKSIDEKEKLVLPLIQQGLHEDSLKQLASLRTDVDRFFDEVLVMSEDAQEKHNRLMLLCHLRDLFLESADISKLS